MFDRWCTICGIGWDIMDSQVICRQLGLPNVSKFHVNAFHGRGQGIILEALFHCQGTEDDILTCPAVPIEFFICTHNNDLSVICGNTCIKNSDYNSTLQTTREQTDIANTANENNNDVSPTKTLDGGSAKSQTILTTNSAISNFYDNRALQTTIQNSVTDNNDGVRNSLQTTLSITNSATENFENLKSSLQTMSLTSKNSKENFTRSTLSNIAVTENINDAMNFSQTTTTTSNSATKNLDDVTTTSQLIPDYEKATMISDNKTSDYGCENMSKIDDYIFCQKAATPEFTNVTIKSKTTTVIFSTRPAFLDKNEGPFTIVASMSEIKSNSVHKTVGRQVFPSATDIFDITIYDKNHKKLSFYCDILFTDVKGVTKNTDINEPACYFTHERGPSALWSKEGCQTIYKDDYAPSDVNCKCSHMTSFVILLKPKQIKNDNHLSGWLINVGVGISIVFLLITLIVICSIRDLRNSDRYKILRHLVIALMCSHFFFLFLDVNIRNNIACSFIAACLHYSLLVAFFWMLAMSSDIFMKITRPFADHEKRFLYTRYIVWITPIFIVGITVLLTNKNYTSEKCWLNTESGSIWSFISFVCFVLLIVLLQMNYVGYLVYKKIRSTNIATNEAEEINRIRTMIVGMVLLLPVVGLPWIFGVIVTFSDSVTMQYIFVALQSLQGFFIWLTQCVFSNEVRGAIRKITTKRVSDGNFDSTTHTVTKSSTGK